MKRAATISIFYGVLLVLVTLLGCQSNKKQSFKAADESSWSGSMQGMAESVKSLAPFVFSRSHFENEKNKKSILRLIEKFHQQAAHLPSHVGEEMLGKDPIVRYSVSKLKDETAQALIAFKEGQHEYARSVLRNSLSTCFNCHTTKQFGPEFTGDKVWLASSLRLSPTEQAGYYVATRQYDHAIQVLETILTSDEDFYESPYEQSGALRKYLAIEVRVRKDPKRAAQTLEKFLAQKKVPHYLAQDTEVWLSSLRNWMPEKKSSKSAEAQALALIKQARQKTTSLSDQSGLVEYLRASSLLHEATQQTKDPKRLAKQYLLLGGTYDVLSDLGVWDLPEIYFSGCIHTLPNSSTAEACYRYLERGVVAGYSGSAGIMVPIDERLRLKKLREKAFRKK